MAPKRERRSKRFPLKNIRLVLGGWWDEHMNSSLRRPRQRQEVKTNGGTVFDIQPLVSAAQAIEALVRVESLVEFTTGVHLIRRDGYNCKEGFVEDICLRLKAEFNERIGPPQQPNSQLERR
jgi:hypothetical protein